MKKAASFLAIAAALAVGTSALAATSNIVGFYTVTAKAAGTGGASDVSLSVSLNRPADLTTTVTAVSGNDVTLDATLTASQYVYAAGTQPNYYYLLVKDGSLEGKWYEITANDTTTVTVDQGTSPDDVETQGLAAGAQVSVIPFWSLGTLFPGGAPLDVNTNPFAPTSFVLFPDMVSVNINLPHNTTYFYWDGTGGAIPTGAGWYDNSNPFGGLKDDIPITPDSYLLLRNGAASAKDMIVTGDAPTTDYVTDILTQTVAYDNQVPNPYPIDLTLPDLMLVESGALTAQTNPFAPTEFVLLYEGGETGINVFPPKTYFYWDGTGGAIPTGAGWYDNSNPFGGLKDADELVKAGMGVTVRRAAGTAGSVEWTMDIPYTP